MKCVKIECYLKKKDPYVARLRMNFVHDNLNNISFHTMQYLKRHNLIGNKTKAKTKTSKMKNEM